MSKKRTNYDRLDAALAHIDELTSIIKAQNFSITKLISTARAQSAKIDELISRNFETTIIDNLKKAGVQNTKKGERLKFDILEPIGGNWIQAEGKYTDNDGQTKRVAVSIGSEYGTVGSDQIKEAAKKAVQGLGYDLLLICGFSFDPGVFEGYKRYGKLQVLITKITRI